MTLLGFRFFLYILYTFSAAGTNKTKLSIYPRVSINISVINVESIYSESNRSIDDFSLMEFGPSLVPTVLQNLRI